MELARPEHQIDSLNLGLAEVEEGLVGHQKMAGAGAEREAHLMKALEVGEVHLTVEEVEAEEHWIEVKAEAEGH